MNTIPRINYKYEKHFGSSEKASSVAACFHEALVGNPDYQDTRILLNVEKDRVMLVEFDDSATHIFVNEDEKQGDVPTLEIFRSGASHE